MTRWPRVSIGEMLERASEESRLEPDVRYHEVTIKLWGKGVISRGRVYGREVTTNRRLVRADQFILSKIDARNGAVGVVPPELDGAIVSNDFPSFEVRDEERLSAAYFGWQAKSSGFVELCRAASEGTTNRVRIKESRFLEQEILLPPLPEQQAIVARLDALSGKTQQLNEHIGEFEANADRLLAQRFRDAVKGAAHRLMGDVAPLVRREVAIDVDIGYPELGIRSFGKGTFHKPIVSGMDLGTKRLFSIEGGDLLFSNVFAWEGAIAIVRPEDHGRFGSHRFMTCVVDPSAALTEFLHYYLLSPEGLDKVREASPGGAGRNRTLGVKKLENIKVPIPTMDVQKSFVALLATVNALKARHATIRAANAALLPATLERLFTIPLASS